MVVVVRKNRNGWCVVWVVMLDFLSRFFSLIIDISEVFFNSDCYRLLRLGRVMC